jgi:hypothetical protein
MEQVKAPVGKDGRSSGSFLAVKELYEVFLRFDLVLHTFKPFSDDRTSPDRAFMVRLNPFISLVYLVTETLEIFNQFMSFPDFWANSVAYERLVPPLAGWGPIGDEQEGESGTFKAPRGEKFPTCEPRMGPVDKTHQLF